MSMFVNRPMRVQLLEHFHGTANRRRPIFSLAISDGILASGSLNGSLKIAFKNSTLDLSEQQGTILCVCFSSCGELLAAGSDDRTVFVYSVDRESQKAEMIHRLGPHTADVVAVAYFQDLLIVCDLSGFLSVYSGLVLLKKMKCLEMPRGMAINSNGDVLAVRSETQLEIYDLRLNRVKSTSVGDLPVRECFFSKCSFSPDGCIAVALASNGKSHSVEILDNNLDNKFSLMGHVAPAEVVAYYPNILLKDGKKYALLAVGGQDRSVSFWTTKSPKPFLLLKNIVSGPILDLAWRLSSLLIAGYDGRLVEIEFSFVELGEIVGGDIKSYKNAGVNFSLKNLLIFEKGIENVINEAQREGFGFKREKDSRFTKFHPRLRNRSIDERQKAIESRFRTLAKNLKLPSSQTTPDNIKSKYFNRKAGNINLYNHCTIPKQFRPDIVSSKESSGCNHTKDKFHDIKLQNDLHFKTDNCFHIHNTQGKASDSIDTMDMKVGYGISKHHQKGFSKLAFALHKSTEVDFIPNHIPQNNCSKIQQFIGEENLFKNFSDHNLKSDMASNPHSVNLNSSKNNKLTKTKTIYKNENMIGFESCLILKSSTLNSNQIVIDPCLLNFYNKKRENKQSRVVDYQSIKFNKDIGLCSQIEKSHSFDSISNIIREEGHRLGKTYASISLDDVDLSDLSLLYRQKRSASYNSIDDLTLYNLFKIENIDTLGISKSTKRREKNQKSEIILKRIKNVDFDKPIHMVTNKTQNSRLVSDRLYPGSEKISKNQKNSQSQFQRNWNSIQSKKNSTLNASDKPNRSFSSTQLDKYGSMITNITPCNKTLSQSLENNQLMILNGTQNQTNIIRSLSESKKSRILQNLDTIIKKPKFSTGLALQGKSVTSSGSEPIIIDRHLQLKNDFDNLKHNLFFSNQVSPSTKLFNTDLLIKNAQLNDHPSYSDDLGLKSHFGHNFSLETQPHTIEFFSTDSIHPKKEPEDHNNDVIYKNLQTVEDSKNLKMPNSAISCLQNPENPSENQANHKIKQTITMDLIRKSKNDEENEVLEKSKYKNANTAFESKKSREIHSNNPQNDTFHKYNNEEVRENIKIHDQSNNQVLNQGIAKTPLDIKEQSNGTKKRRIRPTLISSLKTSVNTIRDSDRPGFVLFKSLVTNKIPENTSTEYENQTMLIGIYKVQIVNGDIARVKVLRNEIEFFTLELSKIKFFASSSKYLCFVVYDVNSENVVIYNLETGLLLLPSFVSQKVAMMDVSLKYLLLVFADSTLTVMNLNRRKNTLRAFLPISDGLENIKLHKKYYIIAKFASSTFYFSKKLQIWVRTSTKMPSILTKKQNNESIFDDIEDDNTFQLLEYKFKIYEDINFKKGLKRIAKKMVSLATGVSFLDEVTYNIFFTVFKTLLSKKIYTLTVKLLQDLNHNKIFQPLIIEILDGILFEQSQIANGI